MLPHVGSSTDVLIPPTGVVPQSRIGLANLEVNPLLTGSSSRLRRSPAVPGQHADEFPRSPAASDHHPPRSPGALSRNTTDTAQLTRHQQAVHSIASLNAAPSRYQEEELIPSPMTSQSDKGDTDGVPSSSHRSRSVSIPQPAALTYSVITFDYRTRCPTGDEYLVVKRVRDYIRVIAPRVRIQAYKERVSHADEDLFDGVVQVVPMFTMLQVSLESVSNSELIHRITSRRWFWPAGVILLLLLFIFLVAQQFSRSQQPMGTPLTSIIISLTCVIGITQTIFFLSLSRQLMLLILKHLDFWMLQFWVAVTITSNTRYTQASFPDASMATVACTAAALFVSLEAAIFLDAFPPISRRWKGVLYLITALFNLWRYTHLFLSMKIDDAVANAVIDFGRFELHVGTAGQSANAALFVFFSRLAVRALWKGLDLQLIDFPVNMVPHLDEEAARKAVSEKQHLIQSKRSHLESASLSHPVDSSAQPLVGSDAPLMSSDGTNTLLAMEQQQSGSMAIYDQRRLRDSTLSWNNSEKVWLHVQGSLPCKPEQVEAMCQALQELVAAQGGKINFAVVEESTSFDCDRRTFEPNVYMLSFNPRPILPLPIVFRGMSTQLWVVMAASTVVLGSVAMGLVGTLDGDNSILLGAIQSYLAAIGIAQLLCGVSVDMIKHSLKTLDFWYVASVFAMEMFSGAVLYSEAYGTAMAVLHVSMVFVTMMFVATMDCIVITNFGRKAKGLIALAFAVYCMVAALYSVPNAIQKHPGALNKTVDLYITILSPGSIAIIANIACMLVFLRVAGRTLWMESRLVFMQFGALEEQVTATDAALMVSGGLSSFEATEKARLGAKPSAAESSPGAITSTSTFRRQDSQSKMSFYSNYLGADGGPQSTSHWKSAVKANKNAKFVRVSVNKQDGTMEEVEDQSESDTSAIRFA